MKGPLSAIIVEALILAFPEEDLPELERAAQLQEASHPRFGHFQCNAGLALAKRLKKKPMAIAQQVLDQLRGLDGDYQFSLSPPGFINIRLSPSHLSILLRAMIQAPYFGVVRSVAQKIIVEFSSPNIAKELHVGHLRSTVIGDCLARVFEWLGHDVLRLNHVGDWGTPFGMLIAYMERDNLLEKPSEPLSLSDLTIWYRAAKELFDKDENFRLKAHQGVVRLQQGELQARRCWELLCAVSRVAFEEIYRLLDIRTNERGESFYDPYLSFVMDRLEEKRLLTDSDGARCVFFDDVLGKEGRPLPLIVQKSDGAFNYATTDLAAMYYRSRVDDADRIIVVTDGGQKLHFSLVYRAALAGGLIEPRVVFDHVPFGVVLGADGKKFKTRSGETQKLIDLLQEAIVAARQVLSNHDSSLSETQLNAMAPSIGINALKYADLSGHRERDYLFSYERMLRFDGNTALFVNYALVRLYSVLKGALPLDVSSLSIEWLDLKEEAELDLAFHLLHFGEVIHDIAQSLLPHRLCDFLYGVAERLNRFWRDCRILGSDKSNSRLLLCYLTSRVLEEGFSLLGLKPVAKL